MSTPRQQDVLQLLRHGTAQQRMEFVSTLPPSASSKEAQSLVGSDHPGMVVVALSSMIMTYCQGQDPELGAVLADATLERACELWRATPDHCGLAPTTLTSLGMSHLQALSLLGQPEVAADTARRYIGIAREVGELVNLPSLRTALVGALLEQNKVDEANQELSDPALFSDPVAGIEARRLRRKIDQLRQEGTCVPEERRPAQTGLTEDDVNSVAKLLKQMHPDNANGSASSNLPDALRTLLKQSIDTQPQTGAATLSSFLNRAEAMLARDGMPSELTHRGALREALLPFANGDPPPEQVASARAVAEAALAWATKRHATELTRDSWWGLYLCASRQGRSSDAADALLALRDTLEEVRAGIDDPMKRAGVFNTYPYLFNSLCTHLQKAGRSQDLLDAIESSKGRMIADTLDEAATPMVAMPSSPEAPKVSDRLRELCQLHNFHYLTLFADDDCLFATLVSRHGEIIALDPIEIGSATLRAAALAVKPDMWDAPRPGALGARYENTVRVMQPLADRLSALLNSGVVREGDHLCYCPAGDLYNVPLHYLRISDDALLIDKISVSRVHGASNLEHCLSMPPRGMLQRYQGMVVAFADDLQQPKWPDMERSMDAPIDWLADHGLTGSTLRLENATLQRLLAEPMDHRVIHWSTHGWFPVAGNPFRESYLLLPGPQGLPHRGPAASFASHSLTPQRLLAAGPVLLGSHVSTMACVSGLAREGVGRDILGMDWSLIQSGAASMLSTHWNISAASAGRFFTGFYERWITQGLSRAAAWRLTMLDLLAGDTSPASLQSWAAFSLTGDFR